MFCIRCGTQMRHKVLNGVLLDHCRNCRGIWVDGGEIGKLTTASIASYVKLKAQAKKEEDKDKKNTDFFKGVCQRCQAILQVVTEHGVQLERCPDCKGTFFDYQELDKILEQRSRLDKFLDWATGLFGG